MADRCLGGDDRHRRAPAPCQIKSKHSDTPDTLSTIVSRTIQRLAADHLGSAGKMMEQLTQYRDELTRADAALRFPWHGFRRSPGWITAAANRLDGGRH